jgi:acyl carrier protein
MNSSRIDNCKPSREQIGLIVTAILKQLLRDRSLPCDFVNENTILSEEIGLTSMDALQLLALIDSKFGTRLPFEKWIVLENGYRTRATVHELSDFIEQHFYDVPRIPEQEPS